ncbi:MAG: YidC/Oxa1 family membrane protein insertase [Clostridia bacterium]|nr:YidC/Oxa1 family membrane protein insertase [Clostridia bacterium]
MTFGSILGNIFIGPLKLIFEIIFEFANRLIGHPGLAIIFLSLMMNILVLPLYRRADAMQEESRDTEAKLSEGVAHIKKTFSGDERMMILQTYYRQNNYKPTNALNGSISLLLEIPFFMAAYQFLSHLEILNGVSLGPIKDLGAPDGLIVIGGIAINLLPILMTLVNVISSAMYLKGFPLKTKIQLYAMAGFFLVFLYTSPSCLVFYWTLNNVFSLVKTIFYKLKNPKKVLNFLMSAVGLALLVFVAFFYETESLKRQLFITAVGIGLQLPLVLSLLKNKLSRFGKSEKKAEPNKKLFWLGAVFMTVLVGFFIPSTYIAASPQEFVNTSLLNNPIWYIVSALCLSAGTFIVWFGVFYWLASPKGKVVFDKLVWVMSGVMLVNYMFFGTKLGNISASLQYDEGMMFELSEKLINLAVVVVLAALLVLVINKWKKVVSLVLVTAIVALGGMSVVNATKINGSIKQITSAGQNEMPSYELSTEGQNVVVIMLDRALNEYIPYIFNEKPELKEQFAGFTYYSNTISFGAKTNFGSPPIFGGYEYTPVEMNKRDEELLVEKHNEALLVTPVLFSQNNFDVTVCDPIYPNYQWIPDLSIYDEYPEIDTYITKDKFGDVKQAETVIENNYRNFFCFGVMKSSPLFIQPTIYNNGAYNQIRTESDEEVTSVQTMDSMSTSTGMNATFVKNYNAMLAMPYMTKITDEAKNTFVFMSNDMTHDTMLLQTPDYVPAQNVDNTEYDAAHADRFVVDGKELKMETNLQMAHYHANMAAMINLGKWFDYLRENNVYDNTRIILVSDHGQGLMHFDDMVLGSENDSLSNTEYYYPLLMVKDFNSKEFVTNEEFMTNADVPTLAMDGLIENPVNPFTGKPINSDAKYEHDQFVIVSIDYDVLVNNGYTFMPAWWASVKDDMRDADNWTFYDGQTVLKDHKAP